MGAGGNPTPKPTPKPYIPSDDVAPYEPSSDSNEKKKSRWFRHLMIFSAIGAVGYYVYKKRFEGFFGEFNFGQYRRRYFGHRFGEGFGYGRVGNNDNGSNEIYLNLSSYDAPPIPPSTNQHMMGGV